MAFHYWNGSSWQTVNNSHDTLYGPEDNKLFRIWNGSQWEYIDNSKVWNGSTWKGFVDRVQISDDFASNVQVGDSANAEWAIYSSGSVNYTQDNSFSQYEWIINTSNSNQYEIIVSQTFGDILDNTSSPLDTWLDLASTHVWRVFANEFNDTKQAVVVAEIRHKITQQVVATNTINLYATITGNPGFPI
jgi:hypothetical protein